MCYAENLEQILNELLLFSLTSSHCFFSALEQPDSDTRFTLSKHFSLKLLLFQIEGEKG